MQTESNAEVLMVSIPEECEPNRGHDEEREQLTNPMGFERIRADRYEERNQE